MVKVLVFVMIQEKDFLLVRAFDFKHVSFLCDLLLHPKSLTFFKVIWIEQLNLISVVHIEKLGRVFLLAIYILMVKFEILNLHDGVLLLVENFGIVDFCFAQI